MATPEWMETFRQNAETVNIGIEDEIENKGDEMSVWAIYSGKERQGEAKTWMESLALAASINKLNDFRTVFLGLGIIGVWGLVGKVDKYFELKIEPSTVQENPEDSVAKIVKWQSSEIERLTSLNASLTAQLKEAQVDLDALRGAHG